MNRFLKLLTLFIVFVMLVQSTALSAFALTPNTNTNLSNVTCTLQTERIDYDTEYNSGIRFMTATTLDGSSADDYYTGTNEYDILSQQSSSAILDALRTLMTSTHKKNSSYADCGTYADNTDCQNEDGKVYLIYTNAQSTSSGGFSLWNREHVWPKSLGGYDTSGPGADLHHIRPSDNKVNSTRNNNKYGNVSGNKQAIGGNAASGISGGTYSDGYFEPHDAVKGDVARICLYMYVRYGGSWSKCSNITNVFQSVDVLLEWCELDPVDTWELGRNEVIEAYQGNRNVFIDYPEYAWLIFGKTVPSDMVTPSGEAQSNGHHWDNGTITTQATCTTTGIKTYRCTDDGCIATKTETISSLGGHSWDNGNVTTNATCEVNGEKLFTCSRCGSTQTTVIAATGHTWGDWVTDVPATDTTTGTKHRECAICHNIENRTIPKIGHDHDYKTSVVTDPTCTTQGYTTHTCDCGESYVDSYTAVKSHTYANGLCTVCGEAAPVTPLGTKEDFYDIIRTLKLGLVSGEAEYQMICDAISLYNSLSKSDKEALSEQYTTLIKYASDYNTEIAVFNSDSTVINHLSITLAVTASVLPFAALLLLKKKEF